MAARGGPGKKGLRFASKALGAHRLVPVRKRDAHYSSLRGADLAVGLFAERRVLARRGWVGEKSGFFEHPEVIQALAPY